jgi:prevent-host-death family protein
MKIASITETKNNLCALLDAVRHGSSVLILDRNEPVARIEPAGRFATPKTQEQMRSLERRGLIRRPSRAIDASFFHSTLPRTKDRSSVVAALVEERKDDR